MPKCIIRLQFVVSGVKMLFHYILVKTISEHLHDQESCYSTIDMRELEFDAYEFDDSLDSCNHWSRQVSCGPEMSIFKDSPTTSRRTEHTLGKIGYNRVHLKMHHPLQEDTLSDDYCSMECLGAHSQR